MPKLEEKEPRFKGPLGIWVFPILNFIYEFIQSIKSRSRPSILPRIYLSQGFENVEEWEIIRDETGRLKKIVAHRKVRESE
jgi:hypothetical protein